MTLTGVMCGVGVQEFLAPVVDGVPQANYDDPF